MRTNNPVFGSAFSQAGRISTTSTKTMTVSGTIDKAVILFFVMLIGATYAWNQFYALDETAIAPGTLMTGGLIIGLIAALATIFKPRWAPSRYLCITPLPWDRHQPGDHRSRGF